MLVWSSFSSTLSILLILAFFLFLVSLQVVYMVSNDLQCICSFCWFWVSPILQLEQFQDQIHIGILFLHGNFSTPIFQRILSRAVQGWTRSQPFRMGELHRSYFPLPWSSSLSFHNWHFTKTFCWMISVQRHSDGHLHVSRHGGCHSCFDLGLLTFPRKRLDKKRQRLALVGKVQLVRVRC